MSSNDHFDVLIQGATLADGSRETQLQMVDVGLRDGRIARVAPSLMEATADQKIEARGSVLAPGFIDMHAHADLSLLSGADADAKLMQGVTTQVIGQDGLGYAPVNAETKQPIAQQIAGWNGPLPSDANWWSMAEYLDRLDQGMPTNAVVLTPHGNLRMMVMGNQARMATDEELVKMQALLAKAMDEGSGGLSTGLTYTPATYADTRELVALCQVVADRNGYFSPHTRSYGKGALDAYQEMIEVAQHTGVRLHLTHATMNFPKNRGRVSELLQLVDEGRTRGLQISLDTYPYTAGATSLSALLPSWAFEGGTTALLERLGDLPTRARIIRELDEEGSDGAHGTVVDWDAQQVASVGSPELEALVGATIQQIHDSETLRLVLGFPSYSPAETALDLMIADILATTILMHVGHEENIVETMKDSFHTVGTDGITHGGRPHPRSWGTFARFLGHYTRDLGVMGLPEAVNHMTGRAAEVLGLTDRGLVREGYVADLVLFDPNLVQDRATYEQPKRTAAGVRYVWVGGKPAVREGKLAETRAGRVLHS